MTDEEKKILGLWRKRWMGEYRSAFKDKDDYYMGMAEIEFLPNGFAVIYEIKCSEHKPIKKRIESICRYFYNTKEKELTFSLVLYPPVEVMMRTTWKCEIKKDVMVLKRFARMHHHKWKETLYFDRKKGDK